MIVLALEDPMNVAGEIGGSGIRMARSFLRVDLERQAPISNFMGMATFAFLGGTGPHEGKQGS